MPNLKASIKDVRKTKKRTQKNLRLKRRYKDSVKKLNSELDENKPKEAKETLSRTYKLLDKAAKNKLLKKNTVARKKSRLTKKLNKVMNDTATNVQNTKKDS